MDTTPKTEIESVDDDRECAICLQKLLYPVTLPCKHTFCYLCTKGIRQKCAMCRLQFSIEEIEQSIVIKESEEPPEREAFWMYQGRNHGWWQYDERTTKDIEEAFQDENKKFVEISVAGYLYVVDFERMIQYRQNDVLRIRKVKRESHEVAKSDLSVKGIAGLRKQRILPANSPDQSISNEEVIDEARGGTDDEEINVIIDQITTSLQINDGC